MIYELAFECGECGDTWEQYWGKAKLADYCPSCGAQCDSGDVINTLPDDPSCHDVSSRYGAPMGRRSDNYLEGKAKCRRVILVDGDYDLGGAYWGGPTNLWVVWDELGNVVYHRAAYFSDLCSYLLLDCGYDVQLERLD